MISRIFKAADLSWMLLFIASCGVLYRVCIYMMDASLWLDEIMLAVNFVRRDGVELLGALDYGQLAPPLFLLLVDFLTMILGFSEGVLRLVPFVSSCLAIIGFAIYAKRYLSPLVGVLASTLLAFSPLFVYFSTNLKPYASDLLVSVILLHVFSVKAGSPRQHFYCFLGVILAPWVSFPSIFALCGLAAGTGFLALFERDWSRLKLMSLLCVSGVLSVALLHFLVVQGASADESLNGYWEHAFFSLPLLSLYNLETLTLGLEFAVGMRHYGLGFLASVMGLLTVAVVVGLWRNPVRVVPCVFVILAALVAASLELYPFHERLLVYLIPFCVTIAGHLLDFPQLKDRSSVASALLVFGLVVSANGKWQQERLADGFVRQEVRESLRFVAENQKPGEAVFVVEPVDGFCDFYEKNGVSISYQKLDGPDKKSLLPLVDEFDGFWVISEIRRDDQLNYLETLLRSLDEAGLKGEIRPYDFSMAKFKGMRVFYLNRQ